MVRLLYFNRCPASALPTLMGIVPAQNRAYFNPTFFTAASTTDLEPREEVLIRLDSANAVYKYIGFVDTMLEQMPKSINLRVVNWHNSKKIKVTQGMTLDDLLSCPFIDSQFCIARCSELDEVEGRIKQRPVATVRPLLAAAKESTALTDNHTLSSAVAEVEEPPYNDYRWINHHYV